MNNKTYKNTGSFLNKKLIDLSIMDKLNMLLKNPSKLSSDELTELKRIKALKRTSSQNYKDYINTLYNNYYINNN